MSQQQKSIFTVDPRRGWPGQLRGSEARAAIRELELDPKNKGKLRGPSEVELKAATREVLRRRAELLRQAERHSQAVIDLDGDEAPNQHRDRLWFARVLTEAENALEKAGLDRRAWKVFTSVIITSLDARHWRPAFLSVDAAETLGGSWRAHPEVWLYAELAALAEAALRRNEPARRERLARTIHDNQRALAHLAERSKRSDRARKMADMSATYRSQNSKKLKDEIVDLAAQCRRRHPDFSNRNVALHIAQYLSSPLKLETVRKYLQSKKRGTSNS